jgi:hypothetical protein
MPTQNTQDTQVIEKPDGSKTQKTIFWANVGTWLTRENIHVFLCCEVLLYESETGTKNQTFSITSRAGNRAVSGSLPCSHLGVIAWSAVALQGTRLLLGRRCQRPRLIGLETFKQARGSTTGRLRRQSEGRSQAETSKRSEAPERAVSDIDRASGESQRAK